MTMQAVSINIEVGLEKGHTLFTPHVFPLMNAAHATHTQPYPPSGGTSSGGFSTTPSSAGDGIVSSLESSVAVVFRLSFLPISWKVSSAGAGCIGDFSSIV